MFIYDYVNSLFSNYILFVIRLDKDISNIRIFDLALCHLNFGAALILKSTDRLTILANDKANGVIRYRDDVGRGRGCTIRCHHTVI